MMETTSSRNQPKWEIYFTKWETVESSILGNCLLELLIKIFLFFYINKNEIPFQFLLFFPFFFFFFLLKIISKLSHSFIPKSASQSYFFLFFFLLLLN
jgi:hypothetical protein